MNKKGGLFALAALVGIGVVAAAAQATPGGLSGGKPAPKVPKKPIQPQNIPGDVSGNPGAVVTPPPPEKMQAAAAALSFAKAQFQGETPTAQAWKVTLSAFAQGVPAGELIEHTKQGHIFDSQSGGFVPAAETQPIQALLHENLADAVVRYKPTGPAWTDLPLAGTWYLVAEEGQA